MDRFGPTWKVSKKRVHLFRWTTFPDRTGWNFGWMDRALWYQQVWQYISLINYYSVRMLSVERFDTNKYILLYSPYISFCNNEDFLLQIFRFCAIFSICFPLLLTSTSYPYIKSALPLLCSFFLFLALRAHFRKLASLAYWSLFVKNKKTSSVYTVFSLSGGNRCNLPPETTILTTCNGLKVYWSTYKTSCDLIWFSHATRKWMSMEKH